MNTHRTGAMTAIGILNIVLGAIGSLTALRAILGGGLMAAGGAVFHANARAAEAESLGTAVALGGGMFTIIGLIDLAAWMLLLVSGVGVLKLAPWGRTLSIICGVVGALLTGGSLVMSGFAFVPTTYGTFLYCVLLVALFMQPPWKAAFASGGTDDEIDSTSDEFRKAA